MLYLNMIFLPLFGVMCAALGIYIGVARLERDRQRRALQEEHPFLKKGFLRRLRRLEEQH